MSTIEVRVPTSATSRTSRSSKYSSSPVTAVKAEDSLVTLESDKATMDVPSPAAGTVKDVRVKLGDKVGEGTLIVILDAAAGNDGRRQAPAKSSDAGAAADATASLDSTATAPPQRARRKRDNGHARPAASVDAEASRPRTPPRRCACSRASWAWI